jgi:hypothetical protein
MAILGVVGFMRTGPDIEGVPGRKRGQDPAAQEALSAAEQKRLRKMAKRLTNAK